MLKLSLLCTQLATEFLFNVGFRTKRNLRGPANDWIEPLVSFLTVGIKVREWFANYGILRHPSRLCEYLLECPSAEVCEPVWLVVWLSDCLAGCLVGCLAGWLPGHLSSCIFVACLAAVLLSFW